MSSRKICIKSHCGIKKELLNTFLRWLPLIQDLVYPVSSRKPKELTTMSVYLECRHLSKLQAWSQIAQYEKMALAENADDELIYKRGVIVPTKIVGRSLKRFCDYTVCFRPALFPPDAVYRAIFHHWDAFIDSFLPRRVCGFPWPLSPTMRVWRWK